MTRCIAILTLALTAALSVDQAFAINPGDCSSALRTGVMITTFGGEDVMITTFGGEDGPEAAYLTLRDMGFSDREAYNMVLDCRAELDGIPNQMSLMQSLCKGEVSHMARD